MQFKIGDKVTVKPWEQLKHEFEWTGAEILIPLSNGEMLNVVPDMKEYCGKEQTISLVEAEAGDILYQFVADEHLINWSWCKECFVLDGVVLAVNKMKKEIYGI